LGVASAKQLSIGDPDLALANLALDGVDQARQGQPLFHQSLGHTEARGDSAVLPQFHQPGERLVLVERFHRQAFDILGQRDFQRRRVVGRGQHQTRQGFHRGILGQSLTSQKPPLAGHDLETRALGFVQRPDQQRLQHALCSNAGSQRVQAFGRTVGAGVDLGDGQIFKRDRLKFHDGVLSVVLTAIRRSSMGRSVRGEHFTNPPLRRIGQRSSSDGVYIQQFGGGFPAAMRAVASNVALAVVSPPTFGAARIEVRHRGVPLVDSVDQKPSLAVFFKHPPASLQRKWNSVCSCVSSIDFMLCLFISWFFI
jgi:hypothetical protein